MRIIFYYKINWKIKLRMYITWFFSTWNGYHAIHCRHFKCYVREYLFHGCLKSETIHGMSLPHWSTVITKLLLSPSHWRYHSKKPRITIHAQNRSMLKTQSCNQRQGGRFSGSCVCIVNIISNSVMDCTGIHQVVDVEWKFGGKSSFLSHICVTLYISSPSSKGFRLFSIACVVLAYIFLILTVFYVFVLQLY